MNTVALPSLPGRMPLTAWSVPRSTPTHMSDPGQPVSIRSDPAAALYRGDPGRAYHEGKRGLPAVAVPWVHRLRADKFQPWVKTEDVVFELGVGAGWNLAALGCSRRVGCDTADSPVVREALRGLGIEFVGRTEEAPDGLADVVLCHHTLEHLLEPAAGLRELRRILKPAGRLVAHVPWERESRYARYAPDEPNHHLHGWNAQTLGNLAAVLGWRIERIGIRRYGYDRLAAKLASRLRIGEGGFRRVRSLLIALRPLHEVELVAGAPR